MSSASCVQPVLDYFPCRYSGSRQLFRGPRRRLDGDFIAYIGGTETFGKFLDTPYPALVEVETGMRSVNLGCINAGIDAYLNDRAVADICAKARLAVIQVMGAQNMSNRYYAVHPRRNDRFLSASPQLEAIYPSVDFTEFTFTRHLLQSLATIDQTKFEILVEELREAWIARMHAFLSRIETDVLLLWMSDRAPPESRDRDPSAHDPMFVDREMIEALSSVVTETLEIEGTAIERFHGLDEMFFADAERPAAEEMLGPLVHRRTAVALAPRIRALTEEPKTETPPEKPAA